MYGKEYIDWLESHQQMDWYLGLRESMEGYWRAHHEQKTHMFSVPQGAIWIDPLGWYIP